MQPSRRWWWFLLAIPLALLPFVLQTETPPPKVGDGVRLGDWPTYRGDMQRTGRNPVSLPARLLPLWMRKVAPPAPAWPEPARRSYWQNLESIAARVVDDHHLQPLLVGGCVLLASSREDDVTCFEAETGLPRWRFLCDAPVRYTPVAAGDAVFFGSDDGFIRCVALSSGALRWSVRVGPEAPMIPGNGRMISPYPVRTGLVVADGTVYAAAGLFPMQGVYAVALDARTGEQRWRRKLEKHSPQGYGLLTDGAVIFPNGRANPFALSRADGAPGREYPGVGGTFAVIADEHLVAGRGNNATLAASDVASGARFVSFPGKDLVVTPRWSVVLRGQKVVALDRANLNELRRERAALLRKKDKSQARKDRLVAIDREMEKCAAWEATVAGVNCAVADADTVYIGATDRIERRSLTTGKVLATLGGIKGKVTSLACSAERLVATTAAAEIFVFGEKGSVQGFTVMSDSYRKRMAPKTPAEFLAGFGPRRGFAVVVGSGVPLNHLLHETDFHVLVVHKRRDMADILKGAFRQEGVYGSRVTVHHVGDTLPYASNFANFIMDTGAEPFDPAELRRIAVPGRSVLWRGTQETRPPQREDVGSWTHQYAEAGNSADSGDRHVRSDLELQWFGGPGPRRMIDRHLRGPPPLAANGRMYIVAENGLIGVDAHNGAELWHRELPNSQRYSMPYDAGYIVCDDERVLAAVDEQLWVIDGERGDVHRKLALPGGLPTGRHWGYVAQRNGSIYGSAMLATAPRTVAGRKEVDRAYRSNRPLVTSRELFALDAKTFTKRWASARGAVVHPTLTVTDRFVCFVESRNAASVGDAKGRIDLATLLASDAWLVALHQDTGALAWEIPLELPECRNILYLAARGERLVLIGSRDDPRRDARYHLRVYAEKDGAEVWREGHGNLKPGQLFHGEQVHHPVLLGDLLVAEPFVYRLADGERVNPDGAKDWAIRRPGHSCGTMSGANGCLFFRANNPTVLDLKATGAPFTKLAPSRAGCWINIIPACGLVLIPEASASCVCNYALQTSMAFRAR